MVFNKGEGRENEGLPMNGTATVRWAHLYLLVIMKMTPHSYPLASLMEAVLN